MATIVTNINNSGAGSLRQAVIDTASGGTINFDMSLSGATITLATVIAFSKNLPIINTNPLAITLSGNNVARIFNINGGNVTMSNFNFINGRMTTFGGGAIRNGGNLTITLCNFSNNICVFPLAAGSFGGGALLNVLGATCDISYCEFTNNTSTLRGGGAIYNAGTMTITNSGIYNNTTVGNTVTGPGGGVFNQNNLTMTNCTVNGNTASFGNGGGIFFTDSSLNQSAVITNCTITNNISVRGGPGPSGGSGGGIAKDTAVTTLNCSLGNTIVALNVVSNISSPPPLTPDILGPYISNGSNFIGDGTGSTSFINGVNGDQVGNTITPIDPLLNPLGNYGGPTQSRTLQIASTCINAGNVANIPPGTIYDQRGPGFPRIIAGNVDIGAVEFSLVCFSGESLVLTKNKSTDEISEIKAKDVYPDMHEVFDTINKKFISIEHNIITGPITRYMKIEKNSLGENKPNEDFLVTAGHKILYNGIEIKASKIPGAKRIKVKPENVYTICTTEKTAIQINNLDVITWGKAEWLDYSTNRGITWEKNITKILL